MQNVELGHCTHRSRVIEPLFQFLSYPFLFLYLSPSRFLTLSLKLSAPLHTSSPIQWGECVVKLYLYIYMNANANKSALFTAEKSLRIRFHGSKMLRSETKLAVTQFFCMFICTSDSKKLSRANNLEIVNLHQTIAMLEAIALHCPERMQKVQWNIIEWCIESQHNRLVQLNWTPLVEWLAKRSVIRNVLSVRPLQMYWMCDFIFQNLIAIASNL